MRVFYDYQKHPEYLACPVQWEAYLPGVNPVKLRNIDILLGWNGFNF